MNTDREHSEQQTKQSRWGFRGKTVWDWMALLIVPLVLVVIGLVFTLLQDARQQEIEDRRAQQAQKIEDRRAQEAQKIENQRAAAERELAEQRAQDEALQAYLDQMSQLILDRKLLEVEQGVPVHEPGDPVHTLAQARTSTAILGSDSEHNESVTHFLINSGLAVKSDPSPRLLREIALQNATLSDAFLPEADLSRADLFRADLSNAFLRDANLSGNTNLSNANLSDAFLFRADLSNAFLKKADLGGADLSGVEHITNEELEQQAASLEGATMPNGQIYEDWLKSKDHEENKKSDGSS